MPRIRYVKPEFFKDVALSKHPIWIRYLYEGLWCQADRDGILIDEPELLKAEIFPYDADITVEMVDDGLEALTVPKPRTKIPFLIRYQVDGDKYIKIIKLWKHQNFHVNEKSRGYPQPPTPGKHRTDTVPTPEQHGTQDASHRIDTPSDTGTVPAPDQHRASTTGTGTGTGTGIGTENGERRTGMGTGSGTEIPRNRRKTDPGSAPEMRHDITAIQEQILRKQRELGIMK